MLKRMSIWHRTIEFLVHLYSSRHILAIYASFHVAPIEMWND